MEKDQEFFNLIEQEHQRQLKGMKLTASESFISDEVMQAMGSCLTNKYAEGLPGKRCYSGCQIADQIGDLAMACVKKLFGAEFTNVRPRSGAQVDAAILLTVLKPGDTFMGPNLDHGGHLSHGSSVNTPDILYRPIGYNLNRETGRIDYDKMGQLAHQHHPKLIIGGGSAYNREWDYQRMRKIADEVGALLMVDMVHPAGLVTAGLLNSFIKYAHIVTSTTHKTLHDPRGGITLMGKDSENPWSLAIKKGDVEAMPQLPNGAVFPGTQDGSLEHIITTKAIGFDKNLKLSWKEYALQVKRNAAVLADALTQRGFSIANDGADNHSMLVDLRSEYPKLTGKVTENALIAADITINKNMVPYNARPTFQTSGIRLGTAAMTTRGAKGDIMLLVAGLIEEVSNAPDDEEVIANMRQEVNETMKSYPLLAY